MFLRCALISKIHQTSMITPSKSPIENDQFTTIRSIAVILALGVVRLHRRQKDLDNYTEQSVHDCDLVTKGETQ